MGLISRQRAAEPFHKTMLPKLWDGTSHDDAALAFVHIPKTAGTWFTEFLAGHFDAEQIAPPLFGHIARTNFSDPEKMLFCGHFLYSNFQAVERTLLPLTFLRDPIARTISQYLSLHNSANFTKSWRESSTPEEADATEWIQKASFDDFVRSENPIVRGHIRDVQTNFLSSTHRDDPTFLSSAIANLERFFFVGIQELSAISMAMFQLQTGSRWSPTKAQMNVSKPSKIELSKAGRERLYELTEHDRKLYAAALRIFDRRTAEVMAEGQPRIKGAQAR
jgi:hypothetical protein